MRILRNRLDWSWNPRLTHLNVCTRVLACSRLDSTYVSQRFGIPMVGKSLAWIRIANNNSNHTAF